LSASVAIIVESTDPKSRFDYKITLSGADGKPITGADVVVSVEGDGSLQPGHDAKQLTRETNAAGEALVSWFRRSIFGRDVKATVTAAARDLPEAVVTLEPTAIETSTTSYRTRTYPLKVRH
jgi:hypothetical protein